MNKKYLLILVIICLLIIVVSGLAIWSRQWDINTRYSVRWTPYAKIEKLKEIDSLFSKPVAELNTIYNESEYAGNFKDSVVLSKIDDDSVDIINVENFDTCSDYLNYEKQGYGALYPGSLTIERFFWFACDYLLLFKDAKPSNMSYVSNFNLENDWKKLPLDEIFGVGQMGNCIWPEGKDIVIGSEVKEYDKYHIKGFNPNVDVGIDQPEMGWDFGIYLIGWGDFLKNDGIEDLLLWVDSTSCLRNGANGNYVILSKTDKDRTLAVSAEIYRPEDYYKLLKNK